MKKLFYLLICVFFITGCSFLGANKNKKSNELAKLDSSKEIKRDINLEKCNGYEYCEMNEIKKVKTFIDYDKIHNELGLQGWMIINIIEEFQPIGRKTIKSEDCVSIKESSLKKTCEYAARFNENIKIDCANESSPELCIEELMNNKKNIKICEKYSLNRLKDLCFSYGAQSLNKINICQKINDKNTQDKCKDSLKIKNSKDLGQCENSECLIKLNFAQDIFDIGLKTDISTCNKINDKELKASCQSSINSTNALKTNDILLCGNNFDCVTSLLSKFVYENSSKTIDRTPSYQCKKISDEKNRKRCQDIMLNLYAIYMVKPDYCVVSNDVEDCLSRILTTGVKFKDKKICSSVGKFENEKNKDKLLKECESLLDTKYISIKVNPVTDSFPDKTPDPCLNKTIKDYNPKTEDECSQFTTYTCALLCLDAFYLKQDYSYCETKYKDNKGGNIVDCIEKIAITKKDLAGCNNFGDSCISKILKSFVDIKNANCSLAGTQIKEEYRFSVGKLAKEYCEDYVNNKKAEYFNDISICRTWLCIKRVLGQIGNGAINKETINTIKMSENQKYDLFQDSKPFHDSEQGGWYMSTFKPNTLTELKNNSTFKSLSSEKQKLILQIWQRLDMENIPCESIDKKYTWGGDKSQPLSLYCRELKGDILAKKKNDITYCGTLDCVDKFLKSSTNIPSLNCEDINPDFYDDRKFSRYPTQVNASIREYCFSKKIIHDPKNLTECLGLNVLYQHECFDSLNSKPESKNISFSSCAQLKSKQEVSSCYDAVSYMKKDISGCTNKACFENVLKTFQDFDQANCSLAESQVPSDFRSKNDQAREECKNFVNNNKAIFYHDVSLCSDVKCVDRILPDFYYLKTSIQPFAIKNETITQLNLTKEQQNNLWQRFYDSYFFEAKTLDELKNNETFKSLDQAKQNFILLLWENLLVENSKCESIDTRYKYDEIKSLSSYCMEKKGDILAIKKKDISYCGTERCVSSFFEVAKDPLSINCDRINKDFTYLHPYGTYEGVQHYCFRQQKK